MKLTMSKTELEEVKKIIKSICGKHIHLDLFLTTLKPITTIGEDGICTIEVEENLSTTALSVIDEHSAVLGLIVDLFKCGIHMSNVESKRFTTDYKKAMNSKALIITKDESEAS